MKLPAQGIKGLSPSYSLAKEKRVSGSSRQGIELFPIKPPKRIQLEEVKTSPSKSSRKAVQPSRQVEMGLKKLDRQTQKINRLSRQMEEAIREFKAIATQVNQNSRLLPKPRRYNVCEYRELRVPVVRQKANGRLVLMSRSVDLSAAYRESAPATVTEG